MCCHGRKCNFFGSFKSSFKLPLKGTFQAPLEAPFKRKLKVLYRTYLQRVQLFKGLEGGLEAERLEGA